MYYRESIQIVLFFIYESYLLSIFKESVIDFLLKKYIENNL